MSKTDTANDKKEKPGKEDAMQYLEQFAELLKLAKAAGTLERRGPSEAELIAEAFARARKHRKKHDS